MERPPGNWRTMKPQMRRSKLEMYIDILKVLANMGPLKLTHIMHKSNFNGSILKEYLNFLIKRGLVEERTAKKNRTVFAVTQRGIIMLKYFLELTQEISAMEEALSQTETYPKLGTIG